MSVVVTGMQMTGKCESCLLRYRHQGAYCTDHCYATPRHKNIDPWTFGRARNGDRPDWCPLRPLPNVHGDLIDRDALLHSRVEVEWEDVVNAPAIVGAEGKVPIKITGKIYFVDGDVYIDLDEEDKQ